MESNPTEVKRNESALEDRSEKNFTRANVMAREDKIRLVDSDEESGLDLFCYNRCSNEDDPFIQQCRGLVFHGENLLLKAFAYTPEYSQADTELLEKIFSSNFREWTFYKSYEGALLRMFFFSGKWFISTHRKLNAYRSKWSSRDSFGTLFERALEVEESSNPEFKKRVVQPPTAVDNGSGVWQTVPTLSILERFQNSLDKNKQYMFLLRNTTENRIVCDAPTSSPLLFHVGTYENGSLNMTENINLSYPQRINFLNIDELLDFVAKQDYHHLQGVIGFGANCRQVKILNDTYLELFRARGNEPSVKFRYLQVRMNKKLTDLLYKLYPNMAEEFDEYEKIIYSIAERILKDYLQRFINKRFVTVPREDFAIIRECHDWHLQDRANHRISLNKVITVLNKQPATNLNAMIRRFKIDSSNKSDVPPREYKGSRNNSPAINPVVAPISLLKRIPAPKLN